MTRTPHPSSRSRADRSTPRRRRSRAWVVLPIATLATVGVAMTASAAPFGWNGPGAGRHQTTSSGHGAGAGAAPSAGATTTRALPGSAATPASTGTGTAAKTPATGPSSAPPAPSGAAATTGTTSGTSSSAAVSAAASGQADGYATGTTGGAGGKAVTVTSASALASAAGASGAAVITVKGSFTCSADIKVTSNKTVIGAGANSGLTGCGLSMKSVSNVIIRNLRISKVNAGSGDAIHIEKSHHLWIDHNDLSSDQSHGKDYYDGLIDITHAADFVTVSWNYLHDHYKAVLIGHSDSNAAEDTGKLHVTLHHNYLRAINSRMPSLRFGTAHVYNNYFLNGSTGSHSRMGAQMLIQNNVYSGVATPIMTNKDSSKPGYVNQSGNQFGNGTNAITQTGSFTKAPYAVTLTPTGSVVATVTAGAGTGTVN